jgi:multidrug efflux pump subunit AcrA (membrane-fusion protein)
MSRLPYLASAAWTCLAFGCIAGDEAKSLPLKLVTHKVQREKLQPMIVERATVESATNDQIVCPVKSRTPASTVAATIKRVLVEDGDKVVKDQLLVELDASGWEEQQKTQEIARDMAAMNLSQAEEQLAVVKAQNISDQKGARLTLELAELDLEKYLKGDLVQVLEDIKGRLAIAEHDVEQAKQNLDQNDNKDLEKELRARLDLARNARKKVQLELQVLEKIPGRAPSWT